MKTIIEYLSSKLNANINFDKTTKKILEYFGIGKQYNKYQDIYDIILKWCKKNFVKETSVYPACDKETYNELLEGSFKDEFNKVKDNFSISYKVNEIFQDELSKVENDNKIEIEHNTIDIYYTENMIACISTIGTIYCWNKEIKEHQIY